MAVSMLLSALCLVTGCQESETSIVQKARVVAAENIELKKQLDNRDTEISALKEQIEECKSEMLKAEEKSGQTNIDLLKIVAELSTETENLKSL